MPTPAEVLRHRLEDERRAGAPFDAAWPRAVRRALWGIRADDPWRAALPASRQAFERAWHRQPPTTAELAAGRLVGILD